MRSVTLDFSWSLQCDKKKKNWLGSLWKSIRFELIGPIVGRWNGAIHWASERTKLCQISNNKRYQEKTTKEEGYHENKLKKHFVLVNLLHIGRGQSLVTPTTAVQLPVVSLKCCFVVG